MAPLAWTLRVYWKRYTLAAVASVLVAKYAAKRFRDNNTIRAYCRQAKRYGEERVASAERDGKPGMTKKVVILLNPVANKRDAKIQFLKYSAPLLHLSGIDATVVESQSEGHLRSLMNYVDPHTDCIVVAGGDGTLMEVMTGLMRRTDVEEMRSIPIGVIPLGRENRFYQSHLSPTIFKSPVRAIGDATMDIIRCEQTKPLHLMQIKPEAGRLLYALSSLQWGPMRDAYENRDGFRLFGKLRLLFSHLNVTLRRWPTDYVLHVWYPRHCRLEEDSGSPSPPPQLAHSHLKTTVSPPGSDDSSTSSMQGTGRWQFSPIKAHCLRPRYGSETDKENEKLKKVGGSDLTRLASSDLEHKELEVMGLSLSIGAREATSEGGGDATLKLTTWQDGSIRKTDFIKRGWLETVGQPSLPLPCVSLSCPRLVLQPISHSESWVSIDGEVYEAMPVSVTTVLSAFRVITRTK